MGFLTSLVPYHHVRHAAPCNLDCFFCYECPHALSGREPTIQRDIAESLEQGRRLGYDAVVFGAGELTMVQGWETAVERARELGYRERVLLSNLTTLTDETQERLVTSGVTNVVASIFSLDDRHAHIASGSPRVFSRQREALERLALDDRLELDVHLVLTRPLAARLSSALDELARLARVQTIMVSAIEPVSSAVLQHPLYTDGLDLDWEGIVERADGNGLSIIVQNVPACLLGRVAHRSFVLRRRLARHLAGFPGDADARNTIIAAESLYRRASPRGDCVGCELAPACHRYFDYRRTRRISTHTADDIVSWLLTEEGLGDAEGAVCSYLRHVESRSAPGAPERKR